jgi:hypothetical protein
MMKVFIHSNDGAPKLWAADPQTKEVVFGLITYRAGGGQKMVVTSDIHQKINEKTRKGYEPVGEVKTAKDAMCLRGIFIAGNTGYQPSDPEGIVRCAEEILQKYPHIETRAARLAIEALKMEIAQVHRPKPEPKREPEQKPTNLLIVQPKTQPNSDWDLVI